MNKLMKKLEQKPWLCVLAIFALFIIASTLEFNDELEKARHKVERVQ